MKIKTFKILNISLKLIFLVAILFGASILNTCTAPERNNEIRKNEIKFDFSKFYFNKYIEFTMVDSARSIHKIHQDNGFIQIFGDIVRIKTTQQDIIYNINERTYDEENQVYEFFSDKVIIKFDVLNKTMTTYEKDGSGIVYKINSTIRSNW